MTMTDRDYLMQLVQRLRTTPLEDRLLRAWLRHQIRQFSATRPCWCSVCMN